jgi:hypothetical protein
MPTPDDFRRIALAFPDSEEGSHMGHADFRVGGKIFATLGSPDQRWGMVKLVPEQQEDFITLAAEVFKPAAGAWGRGGNTLIKLADVDLEMLEAALSAAWKERLACRR